VPRARTHHSRREIDIFTGTLGKALGGGAGGFVAGEPARHRTAHPARPPHALLQRPPRHRRLQRQQGDRDLLREPQRVAAPRDNVAYARKKIKAAGFNVLESPTAICPIIVHDTAKAIAMSKRLLELGVFVIGFGYPVVPKGTPASACQISAAHTCEIRAAHPARLQRMEPNATRTGRNRDKEVPRLDRSSDRAQPREWPGGSLSLQSMPERLNRARVGRLDHDPGSIGESKARPPTLRAPSLGQPLQVVAAMIARLVQVCVRIHATLSPKAACPGRCQHGH
jgi:hypothetical protein